MHNFANLTDPLCWKWFCPITTGDDILERYAFPETSGAMFNELVMLVVFGSALIVFTLLARRFIQHIKR